MMADGGEVSVKGMACYYYFFGKSECILANVMYRMPAPALAGGSKKITILSIVKSLRDV